MDAVSFGALVLPNEPWGALVDRWTRLEEGGLDSIWSCDHFTNPHKPATPWFEGWISLAGLAQETARVRVGLLVGAVVSRPPTLLAKQAQAVDHLSRGRLIVGLGAGGAPTDQSMWGVEEWSAAERASRFAEYVELVARLMDDEVVDFRGRWYRADGATMSPGFVQAPRPPILLAAHGAKSVRVAARHADIWNTFGPTLEEAARTSSALDEACREMGRDPAEIRRSVLFGIREDTAWRTAEQFGDLVRRWHDAGFRDFLFYDPPYSGSGLDTAVPETITQLIDDTIPELRRELAD